MIGAAENETSPFIATAHHSGQRVVFAPPRDAPLGVVVNRRVGEAHPGDHPAQEPIAFGHRHQRAERLPPEEVEVGGSRLELGLRERVEDAVIEPRRSTLEHARAARLPAGREHHREPGLPALEHLGDQGRGLLEIRIQHDDDVCVQADRRVQPRADRGLMPEVSVSEKTCPRGWDARSVLATESVSSRLPSSTKIVWTS